MTLSPLRTQLTASLPLNLAVEVQMEMRRTPNLVLKELVFFYEIDSNTWKLLTVS